MPSKSLNVRGDERGAAFEPASLIIGIYCEKIFQKFANIHTVFYLCIGYINLINLRYGQRNFG